MNDQLIIFDTTLRDGEQSPGASMTRDEKLRIARQLERMKVNVIEAGFAAASDGDFEAVRAVAEAIKDSTVCSLARANERDIRRAGEAIRPAASGRIHTFIATSPIHMEKKLRMTPDEVVDAAVRAIGWAREYTDDVEFSAEDAGRSELDFLCRIFDAVIKAGATTINVPDTVGYNLPEQFAGTLGTLIERVPNSDKVVWSVHCHNDLGLAVANSLAAVRAGARQVECTINGLGERAGNAALEEVVMGLRKLYGFRVDVDLSRFPALSRQVAAAANRPLSWHKSLVGEGVFTHEAGIHVDGLLKHPLNYQGVDPAELGRGHRLVLGKHSGTHAVRRVYRDLGITLSDRQAGIVLQRIRVFVSEHKRPPETAELNAFHRDLGEGSDRQQNSQRP